MATKVGKKHLVSVLQRNSNKGNIKYNFTKAQQKLALKSKKIKLTIWDVL